jgi:hypothetical protein
LEKFEECHREAAFGGCGDPEIAALRCLARRRFISARNDSIILFV